MASSDLEDLGALCQLLVSRGVAPDADDEKLLAAARLPRHKLDVTLLSAWESAGHSLSPDQRAELAAHRDRLRRYRATLSMISSAAPHVRVVKGWEIGDRYPPGLIRAAGDLDVVCAPGELWQAARALRDGGWEVGAFTLFPAALGRGPGRAATTGTATGAGTDQAVTGWCHVLVELTQPSDSGYIDEPYGVELRTADVATSIRMPAMRLDGAPLRPAAASVLALVAERWERPFRSRDVYDLAVLAGQLDDADAAALTGGLTTAMLWPQMRELSALLRRSGLDSELDQPGSRRATWQARTARLSQSALLWSHPLRVAGLLATSTVDADRGALADRLAHAVHRRIGAWRLLRLGLPLFAVPLPDAKPETGPMTLHRQGPHLVARTPVGSFLMVAGSCPQAWLDEVSGRR